MQLSRAGFSDDDIADLLNTTKGTIAQTRYMANKNKPA
jgi:DNA-binding NarL/FixJ family response regulator